MTAPRCAKCKGLLVYVVETLDIGAKLDVVKCINCGNRSERPHTEPVGPVGQPEPQPQVFNQQRAKAEAKAKVKYPATKKVCSKCNTLQKHAGRGLCRKCYAQEKKASTLDDWRPAGKQVSAEVPAVETVATSSLEQVPITMTLKFASAMDMELLASLETAAKAARRELDQQVMVMLEAALQ